jgi:hypothetical protein
VLGFAVNDAVGAAGGGGGGGGGGATFFLHAPSIITTLSAKTRVIHFLYSCFTSSSLKTKCATLVTLSNLCVTQPWHQTTK